MTQVQVEETLIRQALLARKGASRVLPFRYVAAARAVPRLEPIIEEALQETLAEMPPLAGRTLVLVDVSGSMDAPLSEKSDLTRMDAAATLASMIPGDVRVFTFSNRVVEVPPRRGLAGIDAIRQSQSHGGTYLGQAVGLLNTYPHDRLIVVTDEQSADFVPPPVVAKAYMVNVASAQYGVGFGPWTRINGFSEQVLRYIDVLEHESDGA